MEDLKFLAREAKTRLKSGFWEEHKDKISDIKDKVKSQGVKTTNIAKYYQTNVIKEIKPQTDENEVFYLKVKDILDSVGEVSDIIKRLIDVNGYSEMPYEKKQRYVMELSEKYRLALARYKREKKFLP